MSESEIHDSAGADREIDAIIDRAATQMVMQEPPSRLYAAVVQEVRATPETPGTPWRQRLWPWGIAGMSAAACLAIAMLVWQTQPLTPRSPAVAPATRALSGVATLTPPAEARRTELPLLPSQSIPSTAGGALRRQDEKRAVRLPETAPPVVPSLHQRAPAEALATSAMAVSPIHVANIPVATIPVTTVPIAPIDVSVNQASPIPVNAIAIEELK